MNKKRIHTDGNPRQHAQMLHQRHRQRNGNHQLQQPDGTLPRAGKRTDHTFFELFCLHDCAKAREVQSYGFLQNRDTEREREPPPINHREWSKKSDAHGFFLTFAAQFIPFSTRETKTAQPRNIVLTTTSCRFARNQTHSQPMLIIGIAGGTGSGKTTVVKKLTESLPKGEVAIIPLDSYYKDSAGLLLQRPVGPPTGSQKENKL